MFDEITLPISLEIGAGGLVVLVVLMIFTARLVPRRYYEEALSRIEEERKAKENWRKAAESLLEQNTLLIKRDDISLSVVQAIRSEVEAKSAETEEEEKRP